MRLVLFLLLLLLLSPECASAQVTAEQAIVTTQRLVSVNACDKSATKADIIVCSTAQSKYRLPLPEERRLFERNILGEIPRTSADMALNRECGVHRGQRRCSLRDLRAFGYGGGSVPVRALVMLGKKLVDPDSEIGPLGGYPVSPDWGE